MDPPVSPRALGSSQAPTPAASSSSLALASQDLSHQVIGHLVTDSLKLKAIEASYCKVGPATTSRYSQIKPDHSQVQPGTARYSQVQLGTAKHSLGDSR